MHVGNWVTGTTVEGNASINMNVSDYNGQGIAVIQNTTANSGKIDMSVGSVSVGTLFIGKGTELQVDNNDAYKTDVSVNIPAPAANVYIENLTLAGEANIGPSWSFLREGEGGDAPPAEQPGPVLVTRDHATG